MADGTDPDFWSQYGIKIHDLIAGFFGGVVNAFIMRRSDPGSIMASLAVGALTANYLTEPFSRYLGTGAGTTGFIVGIAGMAISQGIVEASKSWRPFGAAANKGNGNDAR